MEFKPGIIKEVIMYGSPEEFVKITANGIASRIANDGSNFDEIYDLYFKARVSSNRTPDKELEYIQNERNKVKELLNIK